MIPVRATFMAGCLGAVLCSMPAPVRAQDPERYEFQRHEIPSAELLESFDKGTLVSLCLNLYNRIEVLERELEKQFQLIRRLQGSGSERDTWQPEPRTVEAPAARQPPAPTPGRDSAPPPRQMAQAPRPRQAEPIPDEPQPPPLHKPSGRALTAEPAFTSIADIISKLPPDMLPSKSARVWSEVQSELATAWLNRNLRGALVELRANLDITQPEDRERTATFRADRLEIGWLLVREAKITGTFAADQAADLESLQAFTPCILRGSVERMVIRGSPGMHPLTGQVPTFFHLELSDAVFEPYRLRSQSR